MTFKPSSKNECVLVVCGRDLPRQEIWSEQTREEQAEHILGVGAKPDTTQSTMSLENVERHCPGFSALQIPYVLDQKLSNIELKKIAVGSIHSLFLTEDGFVYGLGKNKEGQLLSYDQDHSLHREDVFLPTLLLWFVENNIRIKDIACAGWFSALITTDDELYTVGKFGSKFVSATEPALRSTKGAISAFGVGNEQVVFQYDPRYGDDQVYSLGSNRHCKLGVGGISYADEAVEAQIIDLSNESRELFNFCRLTKIDGGETFTAVLTSQSDVFVAGHILDVTLHCNMRLYGFVKLDLSRLGTALVKDFSCRWYDMGFVDSMKRVFTSDSLCVTDRTLRYCDASTIGNPMVTARARTFHVVDARSGRLFDLQLNNNKSLKLEEQEASSDYRQILDDPNYQITSYASGYCVNMVLLKYIASKTSLLFFMTNLKDSTSLSQFSDVTFDFE